MAPRTRWWFDEGGPVNAVVTQIMETEMLQNKLQVQFIETIETYIMTSLMNDHYDH